MFCNFLVHIHVFLSSSHILSLNNIQKMESTAGFRRDGRYDISTNSVKTT